MISSPLRGQGVSPYAMYIFFVNNIKIYNYYILILDLLRLLVGQNKYQQVFGHIKAIHVNILEKLFVIVALMA